MCGANVDECLTLQLHEILLHDNEVEGPTGLSAVSFPAGDCPESSLGISAQWSLCPSDAHPVTR